MVKKSSLFLLTAFLAVVFLFPVSASAIPSLGVAPGAPGTSGTYYYETGSPDSYEQLEPLNPNNPDYRWTFADTFIGINGVNQGFQMPGSGGSLTVWYGDPNRNVNTDVNIILATNSSYATNSGFSFGGTSFAALPENNQADEYGTSYWGVNLGNVSSSGWSLLYSSYGWSGTWYVYSADVVYDDFGLNDWMFAIADFADDGFTIGTDLFSAKTTSSSNYPVPEPATMLLLGIGLIGMAGIGRKKLKN